MTWLIVVLVVIALAGVAFAASLAGRARRDYADQSEIVPGSRSAAPAAWGGAHTPEAKLHRRLVDATRAARSAPAASLDALTAGIGRLQQEALRIDEHLVASAALAEPHRTRAVAAVEPLVAGLEASVAAVVAVSATRAGEGLAAAVAESELRLQALTEARAEVERADRSTG